MWEVRVRRSLLMISVLVILAAPMAQAQEDQQSSDSLLLIMDASGSMNRVDGDGVVLIDGAKQALRVLVSALPDDAHVGLRVYGHRASNDDKAAGCIDTELVVPVGPVNRDEMLAAIDSYQATGWTPIGLSLQQAVEDLPPAGRRTIVLVSDGVDTCAPPDPCEVAADLAEAGFDLTVHTVGLFLTDPDAERQLQCIAEATGGQFSRADSIVDLVRDLTGIVVDTISDGPGRFMPVIIGSLDRAMAPVVTADQTFEGGWLARGAGLVSTLDTGGTRWFAIDVPKEGLWHIQATASLPWQLEPGAEDYLEVVIVDSQGNQVGEPHAVFGVVVDTPQRLYLSEAGEYTAFGNAVSAAAVTDAASAPPSWNAEVEEEEPYFASNWIRLRAAGINPALYEFWKADFRGEALTPGRYAIGVTWSADRQASSEMEVIVMLLPTEERPWVRDAVPEFVVLPGAAEGDEPPEVSFADWAGEPVAGDTPRRAAEIWTPLTTGDTTQYALWLDEGEILEIGMMADTPYGGPRAEVSLDLAAADGSTAPVDLQYDDRTIRLNGYQGGGSLWRAESSGTHHLRLDVAESDEPSSDLAAILSMFVFEPDPAPPVTTEAPRPEDDEGDDYGQGVDDGGDSPIGIIAIGAAALLAAGGGAWWFRKRRR